MNRATRTIGSARTIAWKELVELRRRPGVLVLVVLGPFAVLALFGLGYRNEELALRTVFVGPAEGPYEDAIDAYTADIDEYVVSVGYSPDLLAASEDLRAGRVDLVIVLPPRPLDAVAANQRSEIAVLHNSIDPIAQIGIDFATEVAVRELNASVVTASIDGLSQSVVAFDAEAAQIDPLTEDLITALEEGNDTQAALVAIQLRQRLERLAPSLELVTGSDLLGSGTDARTSGEGRTIDGVIARLDQVVEGAGGNEVVNVDELRSSLAAADEAIDLLIGIDPTTLARPFRADAESLVREPVTAESHVAPGATALLIQHLAVSLAALSFVRDRRRGILTDLRMGPTGPGAIVLGKLVALSLVAAGSGLTILAGQVVLLDVPHRGSTSALLLVVVGLSLSSVSLGLVLAAVSSTELEASQAAMILLLIGLFFSGFLLDLDRIVDPFRWIGVIAPATPAVEAFRTIQLRGSAPPLDSFLLLAVQTVFGVLAASTLVTTRWRSS